MLLNTFLLKNPGLALDGVIFSAPFFGFSEVFGMSPARIFLMQIAAPFLPVSQTLFLKDIGLGNSGTDPDASDFEEPALLPDLGF